MTNLQKWILLLAVVALIAGSPFATADEAKTTAPRSDFSLDWQALPDLPNALGVAGPFVGVHNDALVVAGGANFPRPVWENEKIWHRQIHVLIKTNRGYQWKDGGVLPQSTAYGAAVSTSNGIVCIGGNDGTKIFDRVFLLRWDARAARITRTEYPSLPRPCAYGQAAVVGNVIYLAGGQHANDLDSAMTNFWALDLANRDNDEEFSWRELEAWPGKPRAFNITARQNNGDEECIYVLSGRRQTEAVGDTAPRQLVEFLTDVWEFTPRTAVWRRRADVPRPVLAGTGIGFGRSHLLILGGDDGSRFFLADVLKDKHPGFPKEAFAFHTTTNTWKSAGVTPGNHVTTVPVLWDDHVIIASGEIRPRVRSPSIWSVGRKSRK
ncbi:MAG TPA: hypothetical protein EYG57_01630 [Planctomycetes bacterium]|nr:hypothetical protein [Planctomycetota bacterium]